MTYRKQESQQTAAARAGISERTARHHEQRIAHVMRVGRAAFAILVTLASKGLDEGEDLVPAVSKSAPALSP